MSKIKDAITIGLIRAFGMLPLSWARRFGSALADIAYWSNSSLARVTRFNLRRCLAELEEPQLRRMVRASLRETGKVAAEVCVVWRHAGQSVQQWVLRSEGEDMARAMIAEGNGLLVMSPHLGNWEVLGLHLPSLGPTTSLYQPPKMASLETLVRDSRQASGSQLVPTTAKGVAALLKTLKNGGISGILPDQNPNDPASGRFAPFFGYPALTMTLVHRLIQRTGCRVLFAYAKRVPKGFEIIYREPPMEIYSTVEDEALAALNRGVESLIREAPEQYQWEYKRYKRQPQGSPPFYPF